MVEKPRSKISWGFYLKLVFAAVVFAVLGYFVPWRDLVTQVKESNPRWFALGLLFSFSSYFIVTLRWHLLMRIQQVHLGYRHALSLTFIGQFFSAFLFGANGGDAMRVFYAIRATPKQKAKATMTIVIDRIMGTAMVLVWILAMIPFEVTRISGDPEIGKKVFYFKVALALLGVGILALFFTPFQKFPPWCHRLWLRIPRRDIIAGLHADSKLYLKKWPLSFGAILCATAVHGCNFMACYCLALGYHINVSFSAIVIIMAFTLMATATPTSIGGHGIREFTLLTLFTLFQVTNQQGEVIGLTPPNNSAGLAFSFTFYLLYQFSWSVVGGLVYLFYHHQVKKEDGEAEALAEAIK